MSGGAVWNEISTPKGVLKYRMPNIAEGYFFLSLVDGTKTAHDVIRVKGVFLQEMSNLIKWEELGYEQYSDLLFDRENMTLPLKQIADELMTEISSFFRKKN